MHRGKFWLVDSKEKERNNMLNRKVFEMTVFFTIAGTNYRHGTGFMKPGMKVKLVKEPDNQYDREAIRVEMEGLGIVGYVANSTRTVIGESYSAGRLYDKIGDKVKAKIFLVDDSWALCKIKIEGDTFHEEKEAD